MREISFITSNSHKYEELKNLFTSNGLKLKWIRKSLPELQATSLEEVARYSLSTTQEKNIFLEDTGFFINGLKGFPGVYSRYVYDTIGNEGILKLLENTTERRASFTAVMGFKDLEGKVKIFKGEVKGYVSTAPKGEGGFGYDPIFLPEGHEKTFAEDEELKSRLSHRRRAAEKLINQLKRNQ